MIDRLILLVAIAWAGALWTVCGMVAPTLFAILDDRSLAGRIAGTFFGMVCWLGLAAAVIVLAAEVLRRERGDRWLVTWAAVAGLLPLTSEWALTPMMQAARTSGDLQRFGALHGVSAVLFAGACLAVLGVVLRLTRPAV